MLVKIAKDGKTRIEVIEGKVLAGGKEYGTYVSPIMFNRLAEAKKINPDATHQCGPILLTTAEAAIAIKELNKWAERHLPNLSRLLEIKKRLNDNAAEYHIKKELHEENGYLPGVSIDFDICQTLRDEYALLINDRVQMYIDCKSVIAKTHYSDNTGASSSAEKCIEMLSNGDNLDKCKEQFEKRRV